jgi:hypothetical protein
MSERKPRNGMHQHTGIGLVTLLVLSTMASLAMVPSASAAVSGNLGIEASSSPLPDAYYKNMDAVSFSTELTNHGLTATGAGRTLTWFACEGIVTVSACKSVHEASGTFTVPSIASGASETVSSTSSWTPGNNANGVFTVLYTFSNVDQDPSDDAFLFQINVTNAFIEAVVQTNHNPLEHLQNLATYDGESVLNSNTEYILKSKGQASVCSGCVLDADFGWQLWDLDQTEMFNQDYRTVTWSGPEAWDGFSPFNLDLPAFTHSEEGRFLLKYGLFNSTGNPSGDLNAFNDLAEFEIVLNDSIDLKIDDVYPSHDRQGSLFYFGTERVVVEVSNPGNTTVEGATLNFEVYDQQYELEVADQCDLPTLHPGQATSCSLNMTTTGDARLLRAQLPTIFSIGRDVRMGDNLYTVTADVDIGPIYPNIQINSQNKIYLSDDHVELVGRFSDVASQPLNFTWREGFYPWGYGQVLNLTGETFGLGHHNISLEVRDPWGNTEYTSVEFDVLNALNLSNEPYFTGRATTEAEATFDHAILLPELGVSYSIGQGKSPLMLIDLNIEGLDGNENGLRGIDLDLNLSALLPESIDLATVDVRYLPSTDTQLWSLIEGEDTYAFNSEGDRISLSLTKDGVLLLIGNLPPTDVHATDFAWSQREGGQIQLDWTAQGDITNPYVGGWNIYRISGIEGTTVFPDPEGDVSDAVWEELTATTLAAQLSVDATQWLDPEPLETGICASYAIAPVDREGLPNYDMINVTRVNGVADLLCGDAIAPSTTVERFTHTWRFTNSTDCYDLRKDWSLCYEVTLNWEWPEHEPQGNVSWNLYRVELAPDNVNLRFIEPIAAGLMGEPGESASFTQSGLDSDGVRPYRTYYYILAPIDSVGNEQLIADHPSPNIERVHIDDDWWTFNQHVIPPEPEPPEPPLGMPWLQKLNDATQVSEFQVAGVALLATVLLNFILLPLILKKRKRLKRVMDARKRNIAASTEFDDFFE